MADQPKTPHTRYGAGFTFTDTDPTGPNAEMHENVDSLVAGIAERYAHDKMQGAAVLANALGQYVGTHFPTPVPIDVTPLMGALQEVILTKTFTEFHNRGLQIVKDACAKRGQEKP